MSDRSWCGDADSSRARETASAASQIVFAYASGPLAWSILAFRNSLVFHSLDKVGALWPIRPIHFNLHAPTPCFLLVHVRGTCSAAHIALLRRELHCAAKTLSKCSGL